MDQDREIFKLQAAAQHYEATLQMGVSYLDAFVLAVMILVVGVCVAGQVPWLAGVLVVSVSPLVAYLRLRTHLRQYECGMEKLDQHLQNLEKGQAAPTLKELIGE
jgi:NADH:ubiquinone oxidoreductase subunit 3 (subunit A)